MITRIALRNFRRHVDTEIAFPSEAQVVLIAGSNGAGKTSVLEAIQYALYGQGRTSKTKLSSLVRRGAELEGMTVELDFTIGGTDYTAVRRREGQNSFAQLRANGEVIEQGADKVTAQVNRVLGMDAIGFRLATVAHQKQIDGLADMTPARRAKEVSRLLRLDAVSHAKEAARTKLTDEKRILDTLGPSPDPAQTLLSVQSAEVDLAQAQVSLGEAQSAIVTLEAELAASGAIEDAFYAAQANAAHARGKLEAVSTAWNRAVSTLAAVVVPPALLAPAQSLTELEGAASTVERDIARAEAFAETTRDRDVHGRELAAATARLEALNTTVLAAGGSVRVAAVLAAAEGTVTALDQDLVQARADVELLVGRFTERTTESRLATQALQAAEELGAACDQCGQDISVEHRHDQAERLTAALGEVRHQLTQITADLEQAKVALTEAQDARALARQRLAHATQESNAVEAAAGEVPAAERAVATWAGRLERASGTSEVDIDALYGQRAAIFLARTAAKAAAEAEQQRSAALLRTAELTETVKQLSADQDAAESALAGAALDADLEAAMGRRAVRKAAMADELALAGDCSTAVAVATERLRAARMELERHTTARARRRTHEQAAVTAAAAAKLLDEVESALALRIRPALTGAVSQLLAILSDGRFSSVELSPDYELSVRDDGTFRSLADCSGGEQDLISLALRLALASVVAERHGSGGIGFLVLDEPFGSQDPGRRETILMGLRGLRGIYGQILLISHVGGLEESADAVVHVTIEEVDGERVALAAVA